MLILALDTTSEVGGVAIYRDAVRLALLPNEGEANQYAITLFELLERALAQARLSLRDIDLYAVANGPGSFTGIRVGLAAARAWGKAFDRPVRGVSVLEAMVNRVHPAADGVFPILDARRGEFFLGCFRRNTTAAGAAGLNYEAADAGWIFKPAALGAFIEERVAHGSSATCIVRAHDQAAGGLRALLRDSLGWQQVEGVLLDSIAEIARNQEQSNAPRTEASLDAYYLRRPDAEVKLMAG